MRTSAILRVILGPDSCQRVVFSAGLPSAVTELETEIKNQCKIKELFRLQFVDTFFGNEFMNLTPMEAVQDKATVKLMYTSCKPLDAHADQCVDRCLFPTTSHPDDSTFSSDDSTVVLTSPESTFSRSLWPDIFHIPSFSYDVELKLEKAHEAFREKGTLLIPDPKLKSDIQGLIQGIKFKVYVTDREFDQVAKALVLGHQCLLEKGSATGYGEWKTSLKYKLSNYRTHLRKINAEFRRITTMPLQSRFLSQLDLHSANLLRVFVKRSGQQGKTLRDIVAMMMDMTEGNTLSAIERTVAGIYVARQTPGSNSSDVGVILEGVVVLRDLENVALATAMLFGFFYILYMRYPSKLHYTLEVIQKIIMELDAADLSRKAQSLTSKVDQ
ncbi:hypothetical protein SRHO_G00074300 [Serrasalmus rhombeus]